MSMKTRLSPNVPLGATNNVVGLVEPLALPAVGDGGHSAATVHTGDAATVGPFAHNQVTMAVQGTAVAAARIPSNHGGNPLLRVPAHQLVGGNPDKGQVSVGMPQRAFSVGLVAIQ